MRKISFLIGIAAVGLAFSSCKKEGCTNKDATNYDADAKKDDGSCNLPGNTGYTVPTTYTFERNGKTSVSFSGQTDRMNMLGEMTKLMKSANTPGTVIKSVDLLNMYANENSPFSDADLNGSTKQLKNKTAGGDSKIQGMFMDYMNRISAVSAATTSGVFNGADGTAGVVQSGSKAYLCDTNGVEYTQLIEKGLMGAVFYHQIQTGYLGDSKMDVDNQAIVEGKNYTKMEHHWDEAFGYFTNATNFPLDGKVYWAKYCDKRDAELGSNKAIMDAFLKGRAAITGKDLKTRDAQRVIIRRELQKVAIATAINYLKEAKGNIADDALRNHELSEAIAFMSAIPYSHEPALTNVQVAALTDQLGNNLYKVKASDIDAVVTALTGALNKLN